MGYLQHALFCDDKHSHFQTYIRFLYSFSCNILNVFFGKFLSICMSQIDGTQLYNAFSDTFL